MIKLNKIASFFLFISMIFVSSSTVIAVEDNVETNGNVVSVISESEDGAYKIKSTLKNILTSDGGKWIYSAELLKADDPAINRIQIQVVRQAPSTDFKFSSSTIKEGLFTSTGSYSKDELLTMVTEGSAKVKHNSFVSLSASYIDFDTGDSGLYSGALELSTSYPQTLFSCEFPINPKYDASYKDWKKGFENALNITCVMLNGTTQKANFTSSTFSVPPAGDESSSGNDSTLSDSNFIAPNNAGITITPSTTDLTFTVACNKACVVARQNTDGTYTRMTGSLEGEAYKFTANSADDQIVVAVKGDVTGDGILDSTDTGQVKAVQLGKIKTFTALQTLAADLDGNGTIESTEAGQIKAAQLGKIQLAW